MTLSINPHIKLKPVPCNHPDEYLRSYPGIIKCLRCGKVRAKTMNARWISEEVAALRQTLEEMERDGIVSSRGVGINRVWEVKR